MNVTAETVYSFLRCRDNYPAWCGIPPEHRPATIEQAYQVQNAIAERLEGLGVKRVGYKIGSTSKAGQEAYGLDEPVYAGIFADTHAASLAEALSFKLSHPLAECEVAVRLGRDIDAANGEVSDAHVIASVEMCCIGCEIVDNRYGDPLAVGVPTILADGFFHSSFALGSPNPNWKDLDLSNLDAEIEIDGSSFRQNSARVLTAVESLQWLARKLALVGTRLRAGEIVLTGSIVPPTRFTLPVSTFSLSIDGFPSMRYEAQKQQG